jgi:hypothetical protein
MGESLNTADCRKSYFPARFVKNQISRILFGKRHVASNKAKVVVVKLQRG